MHPSGDKKPGIPILLKRRDLLELNDIDTYLGQLKRRINAADDPSGK